MADKETKTISLQEWSNKSTQVPRKLLNRLLCDHFYFEGRLDLLKTFTEESGSEFKSNAVLKSRAEIRTLIETGQIEEAQNALIDFDVELVDSDRSINFYLLCHKAVELLAQSSDEIEVLEYIKVNVYPAVDENLGENLLDLLEYLVFKTEENVDAKRKKLSAFINKKILEKYEFTPNEFETVLNSIFAGEDKLSENFKFPAFSSYL